MFKCIYVTRKDASCDKMLPWEADSELNTGAQAVF